MIWGENPLFSETSIYSPSGSAGPPTSRYLDSATPKISPCNAAFAAVLRAKALKDLDLDQFEFVHFKCANSDLRRMPGSKGSKKSGGGGSSKASQRIPACQMMTLKEWWQAEPKAAERKEGCLLDIPFPEVVTTWRSFSEKNPST